MIRILILFLLSLTLLIVAGCSGQKVINVQGESQNWNARVAYEIGEHEEAGKGSLEYIGSEQLSNFSYKINYPEPFSGGASGEMTNINEDDTTFNLTVDLPDTNVDMLRDKVKDITITIMWETVTGDDFEETVEFSIE